jgi:hypothetical protein
MLSITPTIVEMINPALEIKNETFMRSPFYGEAPWHARFHVLWRLCETQLKAIHEMR